MRSLPAQIRAVVAMTVTSLPSRAWASLAAMFAIALTVLTLLVFLAMAAGFSRTVASTGSDDIAIILAAGAKAEATSRIPAEAVRMIADAPGLARDNDGRAMISAEAVMVVEAERKAGGELANLSLRGVSPDVAVVRPDVRIVEGRILAPRGNELVVGASVRNAFAGFELGQQRRIGNLDWIIVGVFDVGDTVFDSEIWGDTSTVQGLLGGSDGVQTIRARLSSPAALADLKAYIAAEPRLRVEATSERDHFVEQAGKLQLLIHFGWALALMLSIGALAGALNTMYAAVEARALENATLRAIGFGRGAIFVGAMVEAVALAIGGAIVAMIVAWAIFNGMTASTLGEGFTQVVFKFTVGPDQLLAGLALALCLGVAGGLLPALRAATAPVLKLGAR